MHWWRGERAMRTDLGELNPVGVDTLLHVTPATSSISLTPHRRGTTPPPNG
jgi:hypothetical protein